MKFVLVLILSLCCIAVHAQDSLRARYGIEGGVSANMHVADFRALPGVPNCCPQFTTGSGTGPFVGVYAAYPIADRFLFSAGLNYVDQSATLQNDERIAIIVNGIGQNGTDRHTVTATLRSIGLEPTVAYRLFNAVFLDAGARVGYTMTKQYSQDERIVGGAGTFLDSLGKDSYSQIRNQNAGDIPQAALLTAEFVVGARYEFPMNGKHTMFLVPSVTYAAALTNVSNGIDWKPNGLRAGIGITFSPVPDTRQFVFDTVIVRDTVSQLNREILERAISLVSSNRRDTMTSAQDVTTTTTILREQYLLQIPDRHDVAGSVVAVGLDDDGNEHPIASLRIEEFLSMNASPLLGYVFFGEGDSVIPSRYHLLDHAASSKFQLRSLFSLDAMGIHHNALNIIAVRLKEHPHAHLTITGCNANVGVESANTVLSEVRARAVYEYFHSVWNIPQSQLSVLARDLPEKPSNPKTPIGQEENRRVELTCDEPEVLDVFLANDTTRIPDPPQLRIKLHTGSSVGVTSWKLEVNQDGKMIHHALGLGEAPSSDDWDLTHDYEAIPHYGTPLTFVLTTTNSKGDVARDTTVLPTEITTVQQKRARHTGDVIIDRYNLVLFDFARSGMLPAHERILQMVRSRLKPTSSILLEGYTDRSGTSAGNLRLATARATASAKSLGRADAAVKGIGDTRLLYPNETPEGRFLCRTVQVTVRTPVE